MVKPLDWQDREMEMEAQSFNNRNADYGCTSYVFNVCLIHVCTVPRANIIQFSSVQSLSRVQLFVTP